MRSWTYMLRCSDGSYYVGCTTDLDQRIAQHQAGEFAGYTQTRRPVECVWASEFQSIHDAIACERQMKGWRRAKKEAVIRGDWHALKGLSKRGATGRER
jgi:predicted GIY-YIG superfamily endonuclease